MSEPVLSKSKEQRSSRLDPPHDLMLSAAEETVTHWMALAGRDPAAVADQLDRQANELLSYARQQNGEIDTRQAELNAKLAQLDHAHRSARLRSGVESGTELTAELVSRESRLNDSIAAESAQSEAEPPLDGRRIPEPSSDFREFEEVESIVAGMSELADSPDTQRNAYTDPNSLPKESTLVRDRLWQTAPQSDQVSAAASTSRNDLRLFDSGVELDAMMAGETDRKEMASKRLAEQTTEIDRRRSALEELRQETQGLYRNALEMRIVTEQLLAEIGRDVPPDRLNSRLAELKNQLREEFADELQTTQRRQSTLADSERLLAQRYGEVQTQSERLQQWVDSRHEELRMHAARIDAREMLLDQREQRMREDYSSWEAEKRGYQDRLLGMLNKLELKKPE